MAYMGLWDPAEELADMRRLINRFFGRELGELAPRVTGAAFVPAVEIEDLGTEFLVRCELPGVSEKDVQITVSGNMLTIRGERKYERTWGGEETPAAAPEQKQAGTEPAKEQGKKAEAKAVSTRAKREVAVEHERPMFSERRYGTFERVITLPDDVDSSKVEATFRNGLLEIRIPRAEGVAPREIPVKVLH